MKNINSYELNSDDLTVELSLEESSILHAFKCQDPKNPLKGLLSAEDAKYVCGNSEQRAYAEMMKLADNGVLVYSGEAMADAGELGDKKIKLRSFSLTYDGSRLIDALFGDGS